VSHQTGASDSSQSPFAPTDNTPKRWQFSIRGMLIFTASVAIGASVWQAKLASWTSQGTLGVPEKQEFIRSGWAGGILIVFIIWFMFGLLYQIRDLWKFSAAHRELESEQRLGLRLEIVWRASVIALLLGYAVLAVLLNQGWIVLPEKDDINLWGGGDMAREAAMILILLLIVASVPHARRKPKWPPVYWLINLAAWWLAISICLKYWKDETCIAHLVHIATIGIDISFPLKFSRIDPTQYRDRCALFYHWSMISAAIVIFNWICLRCLARQWSKGAVRRWIGSVLFLGGIAAVGSFLVWLYGRGLEQISPYFAEIGPQEPWHCWIAIVLVYFILITAMAYQSSVDYDPLPQPPILSWRKNWDKYYHEWRMVLLGLVIAIVCFRIYCAYEGQLLAQRNMPAGFSFPMTPVFSARFLGEAFFLRPIDYLWTGLILIALFRALAKRTDPNNLRSEIPRVNRAKFTAIWLAAAAFIVTGTLALIWMSFGLWFDPHFIGR
jgi:hypothetical protein